MFYIRSITPASGLEAYVRLQFEMGSTATERWVRHRGAYISSLARLQHHLAVTRRYRYQLSPDDDMFRLFTLYSCFSNIHAIVGAQDLAVSRVVWVDVLGVAGVGGREQGSS